MVDQTYTPEIINSCEQKAVIWSFSITLNAGMYLAESIVFDPYVSMVVGI